MRVAVLDVDTGFLAAFLSRTRRLGWDHRVLDAGATPATVRRMRRDVLVVDLSALGAGRWDWLEHVCRERRGYAVVVCSGSSTLPERLLALQLGADAWLEKPCHPEELIARIEASVRHSDREHRGVGNGVRVGELEIHGDRRQAFAAGHSLNLTRRELQLVVLLAEQEGRALAREVIYERVWGHPMQRDERSVDVLVSKVRRKLEAASPGWRYVRTHPGIGYSLTVESAHELATVSPVAAPAPAPVSVPVDEPLAA